MFDFGTFETLFFIAFFLILGIIIFTWIMTFIRALKGKNTTLNQPTTQNAQVITQKEIIREVVKIRCPYCHGLYDETLDTCPHCGAKNT
jgi:DNA-directed RNA polymerase subunit RPC12/RpoP